MPPFALSILLGAFLLFAVQPLVGKFILPWFGGSPGVWTTCLLFFQTLLVGGYAYAYVSTRFLRRRGRVVAHMGLLLMALAFVPIVPNESWKLQGGDDPAFRILLLLLV